jgi:iduronate 2-sulfatase
LTIIKTETFIYGCPDIAGLLDLFPTFCDFAGLSAPETLDGTSFLSIIQDPKAEGKSSAFCQWGNGRTVCTQRWRLTERRDDSAELYDYSNAPAEYHNLIGCPDSVPLVKRLHSMLDKEFGPMGKSAKG